MLPALLCILLAASAPAAAPAPPTAAAPAPPAPPPLEEIVRRAAAVQEKRPQQLACNVEIRASLLDSDGNPKEAQILERSERWDHGTARPGPLTKVIEGARTLPPAELAEAIADDGRKQQDLEARKLRGEGKELEPVFASARTALTDFKLLREEALAGRRTWVLSFTPRPGAKDGRAGTAWIDAETFLALRVTSSPRPLPDHVDQLQIDEEQQMTAQGEAAPLQTKIESSGGFFFLKRRMKLETIWSDCR